MDSKIEIGDLVKFNYDNSPTLEVVGKVNGYLIVVNPHAIDYKGEIRPSSTIVLEKDVIHIGKIIEQSFIVALSDNDYRQVDCIIPGDPTEKHNYNFKIKINTTTNKIYSIDLLDKNVSTINWV